MSINAGTVMAYLDMDTSKYSNAMQTALSQAGAFAQEGSGLSGMIGGIGAGMTTMGRALTMGVTLPIVGAGVAIMKWTTDFEASSNKVATIANTSVLSMDQLNKGVIGISSRTGIAASDINEALYQTISATNDTANALAYTEIAAKAAKGGFTDTETAIDGLTTVMNAYGYKGEEAMMRVSDQMLMAQNFGKTTFGEMAGYIGQVIPIAAALNVGTDELFGSIAALTKQGIGTQQAITGLKAAYSNIIKPTAEASDAAKKLGLDFSASALETKGWSGFLQDVMDKTGGSTEVLAQLFGSVEALNTVMALTSEQGMQELLNGIEAVGESAGATDAAYQTMMDGLGAGLSKLKNSFKNFGISLGTIILPYGEKFVAWLQKGVAWLDSLSESTKKFIVAGAGIAAAIGPALIVGGKLLSLFSGVIPLAGLLAGGFALVYKHSERLQGIVQKLKEQMPVWMEDMKTGYAAFTESMQSGKGVIDSIETGLNAAFGGKMSGKIGSALRAIQNGFKAAKGHITSVMSGVGEFIGSLIDGESAAEALRQGLETAFGTELADKASGVITKIGTAFDSVKSTAISLGKGVRDTLNELWDGVKTDFEAGGFTEVFSGLGSRLLELSKSGLFAAGDWIKGLVLGESYTPDASWATTGSAIWAKIKSGFITTGDWIKGVALGDAYTPDASWATAGSTIWAKIKSGFITTGDWIKGVALGDAYTPDASWATAGSTIWEKIKSGITVTGDWIKGLVLGEAYTPDATWGDVGTKIVEKISSAISGLSEEDISTALGNLGSVMETIAKYIVSSKANLIDFSGRFFTTIATALSAFTGWDALGTAMAGVATSIIGAIASAIPGLTTMAVSLLSAIGDLLKNATGEDVLTSMGAIAGALLNGIASAIPVLADVAVLIIGSIGDLLAGIDWAKATTAASDIAKSLLDGLANLDWKTLFTNAASIVSSIAKVLSENATNIATAALDLGLKLLEGLASLDWATISYDLSTALGNMVTAIGDWFAKPENAQKLLDVGGEIAKGIVDGLWQGFKEDVKKGLGIDLDSLLDEGSETIVATNVSAYAIPVPVIVEPTVTVDEPALQTSAKTAVTEATSGFKFTNNLPLDIDPTVEVDTTAITTETQGAIDAASTTLTDGQTTVSTASQGVTDAITTPFEGLPEETKAQAALMLAGVNEAIAKGTPEATAAIETATTAVLDQAMAILSGPTGMAVGNVFMLGIRTGAILGVLGIQAAMRSAGALGVAAIASAMSVKAGYGIGQSMIQAVISGAGSMASALYSRMYRLGDSAVAAFKSAIQMASPPAAFVEIGEAIPNAVGLGTDRNRDEAIDPVIGMARDMQSAFQVQLGDENATGNPHKTSVSFGQNEGETRGFSFNFYGDMTVRDDGDIERISRQIYEDIQDALRGGGQLA